MVVGDFFQPGESAAECFDLQIASIEISLVDGGDFEFTPFRWFNAFGNFDNVDVVEIEARYCEMAFRLGWLFFD